MHGVLNLIYTNK